MSDFERMGPLQRLVDSQRKTNEALKWLVSISPPQSQNPPDWELVYTAFLDGYAAGRKEGRHDITST